MVCPDLITTINKQSCYNKESLIALYLWAFLGNQDFNELSYSTLTLSGQVESVHPFPRFTSTLIRLLLDTRPT